MPPSSPAGSEPAGETPRLYFPDQPAVPPPPPQAPPPPGQFPPDPAGSWQPGKPGRRGGPPTPARPPRPSRPTAPPRRELRQRALAATIFALLSLLALVAANQAGHASYLVIFALVIAVAACVLGASAARRARREDTARPRGSVAGIILGAVAIILSLVALLGIIFARQLTNYEQCMNNAQTTAAQQACEHRLLQSVQSHYGQQG
jgi:hypothetical protein